jgi:hypothetical protein
MYKNLFDEVISEEKISKKVKYNRCRRRSICNYLNLDILCKVPLNLENGMPILEPYNGDIPKRMVAFDEAYTRNDTNCIVHFYEDDYRFLRLFRNPERYLDFLRQCALVVEPDLSQHADMPSPLRHTHAYFNRLMAVFLQKNGCRVISNLTWSLRDSYQYSISGRPRNSVVAVNCTGILGNDVSMYLWREGYKNVVLPLCPTNIIRYGDRMPGENIAISTYFYNERLNKLRHGR